MEFTYAAYENLVKMVLEHGYEIVDYHDYAKVERPCILRHDVDCSLDHALELAEFEAKIPVGGGIKSTYFVLLTSDFYNVFSEKSHRILQSILANGHEIGLHFDEARYEDGDIRRHVEEEADLLGKAVGQKITTVSMHRPSPETLGRDLQFGTIVNSYGTTFFHDFKYVSDSRMHWREDLEEIVQSEKYPSLHILTHPFWYTENVASTRERLMGFFMAANGERYDIMNENFRDLSEFVERNEVG